MYAYPIGPARDVSSRINYYPVTFLGTRIGREHG
jgi:hypothetical protein